MTHPATHRRRTLALPLLVLALSGLVAAACGRPPQPAGWAAPRALKVDGAGIVLVSHKGHLYALPGQTADDLSSSERWQFPPRDRSLYPLSEESQQRISQLIDRLGGVDDATKGRLKQQLADVKLSGPNAGAFKAAVSQSGAPSGDRDKVNSALDAAIKAEKDALDKVQAFYGDPGVSSDSKTVFVGSFKGMLFALDTQTGFMRWVRDAGSGIVGGIAVDGGTLYFGTKGDRVFAADVATGDRTWEFRTDGEVWATPTIVDDTIYVTSLGGSVYALGKDGKEQWHFSGAGAGVASRAVVAGGMVYAGAFDNKLYALDAARGSLRWTLKADNWFWATPLVKDGVLYAASLDGSVYAVDAATGEARWPAPFDAGAPVRSAPVIMGDGLVVAARNGRVYKLDPATGEVVQGPVSVAPTATVLADLATDGGPTLYVKPTSAVLYVLNDRLEVGSVPLQ